MWWCVSVLFLSTLEEALMKQEIKDDCIDQRINNDSCLGTFYHCESPFFKWSKVGSSPTQQLFTYCKCLSKILQIFSKSDFAISFNLPPRQNHDQPNRGNLIHYPVLCMVKWPTAHLCVKGKTKTTNGLISCRKKIKFCIRAGCTAASSAFGQVHVIGSYFRT